MTPPTILRMEARARAPEQRPLQNRHERLRPAERLADAIERRISRDGYFTPTGELKFGIKRVVSNEPAGTVLRQRPTAGKMVKRGTEITLVVAASPPPACDSSYPNVCIPPYPPDLNCDDVPYNNIAVVGSDPHGFDGYDNDGVGCES